MSRSALYLDDTRKPNEQLGFLIVRSYDEFVEHILSYGLPDVVSFGHDLADEHYGDYLSDVNFVKSDSEIQLSYEGYKEKTGYDAAKWLISHCENNALDLPQCFVHSSNPVGAKNIQSLINNYMTHVEGREGTCVYVRW